MQIIFGDCLMPLCFRSRINPTTVCIASVVTTCFFLTREIIGCVVIEGLFVFESTPQLPRQLVTLE